MKMIYLFFIISILSCHPNGPVPSYESPPGYDLNHPEIFPMRESLLEISGIAMTPETKDTIYAQHDEGGTVYSLVLDNKFVRTSTFRNSGDFEDITIWKNWGVMLRSDGVFWTFPMEETKEKRMESAAEWQNLLPKGEYESMYADPNSDKIFVLCKSCKIDKDKNHVSGYILTISEKGELEFSRDFQINTERISEEAIKYKKRRRFKPSAITFNQKTEEWFILSSINKMLVATDKEWNLKEIYHLNPKIYIQPEGIAFDAENNLYIASEGNKVRPATISRIIYKK